MCIGVLFQVCPSFVVNTVYHDSWSSRSIGHVIDRFSLFVLCECCLLLLSKNCVNILFMYFLCYVPYIPCCCCVCFPARYTTVSGARIKLPYTHPSICFCILGVGQVFDQRLAFILKSHNTFWHSQSTFALICCHNTYSKKLFLFRSPVTIMMIEWPVSACLYSLTTDEKFPLLSAEF